MHEVIEQKKFFFKALIIFKNFILKDVSLDGLWPMYGHSV
jgi:hypothetical protein